MSDSTELTYTVTDMTCGGCRQSVTDKLNQLPGVESFDIDVPSRRVTVRGQGIADEVVRAAIADAGFHAA